MKTLIRIPKIPLVLLAALSVTINRVWAQNAATGAINDATNSLKQYFEAGTPLIYAVCAIIGLIGAVRVYSKWQSGDQDTAKSAFTWFGSALFVAAIATVLKAFFGV